MPRLSESLDEARRIVDQVDAGGVSIERLSLRCTSRLSGDQAVEMHDRLYEALINLLMTGIHEHETRHGQAVCRAILDRIERASVAN